MPYVYIVQQQIRRLKTILALLTEVLKALPNFQVIPVLPGIKLINPSVDHNEVPTLPYIRDTDKVTQLLELT